MTRDWSSDVCSSDLLHQFIATSIYYETDDDYYIDNSILELGNNLVKQIGRASCRERVSDVV